MAIEKIKEIIGISYNEVDFNVMVKTRTVIKEDGTTIASSTNIDNYNPVTDWSKAADAVKKTCDLHFTAEKIAEFKVFVAEVVARK